MNTKKLMYACVLLCAALVIPACTKNKAETAVPKSEQITLSIIDSSDSTKSIREEYNKRFMEENPNVKIEYTTLAGDQYKTSIITAVKSGTAPDLFAIPSGMKLSLAVAENWFMPMDDYVTPEFMDSFLPGALNEGIQKLNGKLYVTTEAFNIVNTLIFYNKKLLAEAGLDPENPPRTWSEFISANDKITKAGKGKYYGFIEGGKQTNRVEIAARALASTAGAKCNDIGVMILVDGKPTFASPAMMDAFGVFAALAKNGSIHPSTVNLTAPEARALFAQGQGAFLVQGSWCIPVWNADNPELDYGVMAMPVPDSGAKGGLPYIGCQPWMGIASTSKHPEIAAKYLMGLYGESFQSKAVSAGGFVSAVKGINEKYMNDPRMLQYYNLAMSEGKLAPDPIVGNLQVTEVYSNIKDVSPNLGQILQGVMAGSVKDYAKELNALNQKTETEWNRAVKAAQDAGVKVSAADFEFKNWNPLKDYTAADYKAR